MESQLQERLDALETKVDEIHEYTRKTNQYLKITAWVTLAVVVLPLIGLLFAIPAFLASLDDAMSLIQY